MDDLEIRFTRCIQEADLRRLFRFFLPRRQRLQRAGLFFAIWLLVFLPSLALLLLFCGTHILLVGLVIVILLFTSSLPNSWRMPDHYRHLIDKECSFRESQEEVGIAVGDSWMRISWEMIRNVVHKNNLVSICTETLSASVLIYPEDVQPRTLDEVASLLRNWKEASTVGLERRNVISQPKDEASRAAVQLSQRFPLTAEYYCSSPRFQGPGHLATLDNEVAPEEKLQTSNHISLAILATLMAILVAILSTQTWHFGIRVAAVVLSLYLPALCIRIFNHGVKWRMNAKILSGKLKPYAQQFTLRPTIGLENCLTRENLLISQIQFGWLDVVRIFDEPGFVAVQHPIIGALIPSDESDENIRFLESVRESFQLYGKIPIADFADNPEIAPETGNPYQS